MGINLQFLLGVGLFVLAVAVALATGLHSIRRADGPRERAFLLRVNVTFWVLILSLLALVYYLPSPYRYFAAAAYFGLCPVFIYKATERYQLLRVLDERDARDAEESKQGGGSGPS